MTQVVVSETRNSVEVIDPNTGDQVTVQGLGNTTVEVKTVGVQGPAGGGTGYQQSFTGSSVVVTHNLGYRPNVTVEDTAGDEVEGNITYNGNNELTISFSASISGTVYCS